MKEQLTKILNDTSIFDKNISDVIESGNSEKLIQFIDKADKAINQLENETLRISSQLSTLLDIENEFSLVKQMHLITEAIHKSAEGITQCLDNERVQRIDRLMEDCRDIAAMMKEYGLLYQYNAQWKKQQRLKDK